MYQYWDSPSILLLGLQVNVNHLQTDLERVTVQTGGQEPYSSGSSPKHLQLGLLVLSHLQLKEHFLLFEYHYRFQNPCLWEKSQ